MGLGWSRVCRWREAAGEAGSLAGREVDVTISVHPGECVDLGFGPWASHLAQGGPFT